jgi:hypothetical protein
MIDLTSLTVVCIQDRPQYGTIVLVQRLTVELQAPSIVGHVEGYDEGVGQRSQHLSTHLAHGLVILKPKILLLETDHRQL